MKKIDKEKIFDILTKIGGTGVFLGLGGFLSIPLIGSAAAIVGLVSSFISLFGCGLMLTGKIGDLVIEEKEEEKNNKDSQNMENIPNCFEEFPDKKNNIKVEKVKNGIKTKKR